MSPKKSKVFYGYWIVAACFFCALVDASGYYCFSLFITPLQTDFGWGRGEIMAALSIRLLASAVVSPFAGRLVDRYGAKRVLVIGAIITGLGFILISLTNNLWYLYLGWGIAGAGVAASGILPATAVVSNWFKKRRGTAIGIMSTGFGAAGVVSPFIGGYIIPNFGWRGGYFTLALLMWAIIPLVLLVVRSKPADMGLYPDGVEAPEAVAVTEASLSTSKGLTLKMALATASFWLIGISFLLANMAETGITQTQVPYFEDIGVPTAIAATTLAVVGIWSAIGKFAFGWLCDHMQAKYARAIGIGFLLASVIMIMSIGPASSLAIIWLYAIIRGFGFGSWAATMSMLVSTNFGLTSYGIIFGMIALLNSVGGSVSPLFAGYMYDTMGTYHWAFIVFIILAVVAMPLILAVRRPKSLQNFKGE